ncbi:MAG TPA: choice-of-anchor tandem repeat GloVer-containing protein [Bryobacteraceae bacterium]|nr:choice-of-anchor tandem repeat GloVer-containing protein [Bryobacteraceae bacterium]
MAATTGGTGGWGVAFKLDAAGNETTLYNFTGGADGGFPMGALARDAAGNLYGATEDGGTAGAGVVFKLDSSGHETVLHTFTGEADGRGPMGGTIRDQTGNLYGTAQGGGATGAGVLFEVNAAGNESTLYSFTGQGDGNRPEAGLSRDSAGNLYGTTYNGGAASAGVVFKLDTAGLETVLYNFTGGADGGHPMAGVILDSVGNLYGTTNLGGAADAGAVYTLGTAGSETVLYGFPAGPDGTSPYAGVIDSAGNLYGATYYGGAYGKGIVYKLDANAHETVLYTFTGGSDGGNPAGVIRDSAGNLYGTTWSGGLNGDGTVYKIDTSGQQTVLHSFGGFDGASPDAGVILDSAGNLYGATPTGGTGFAGTVYMLNASGDETVLYNFTGGADGNQPVNVIRNSAGNLYGTTVSGGAHGYGVVFEITAGGHQTVLYNFTGGADGSLPMAGVIGDSEGNLYGTTFEGGAAGSGVVYKLAANGQETVLYNFAPGAGGMSPASGLVMDSAGDLYGTASGGGASGAGTVYKLDAGGNETVLYSFTGGTDGGNPAAGVVRDSGGNLYGTTPVGGKNNAGVIFTLKNAATE